MLTLETIKARDAARAAYDTAVAAYMSCDATTPFATFLARSAQMHANQAWDIASELLGAPDLSPARREAYEALCLAEVNAAMTAANTASILASSSISDSSLGHIESLASRAHDCSLNVTFAPSIVFTIRQTNRVKQLLSEQ